jgi:hypothetical protein
MDMRSIQHLALTLGRLLPAAFVGVALGQATIQQCPIGSKIALDYDYVWRSNDYAEPSGVQLLYRVQDMAGVSAERVEIWDGGLLLKRESVPVSLNGQFGWNHLREVPKTPSDIEFVVFDPELPPSCTDDCSGPSKGGIDYLSAFWVGSSSDEEKPFSLEKGISYRVLEGSDGSRLKLKGLFVGPSKEVVLQRQDARGQWKALEQLSPDVVDITHLRVNIPPEHLADSGTLGFSIFENVRQPELGNQVEAPQQILYVASKEIPVLLSIYPPSVSPDEIAKGSFHVLFTLYGSGFTSKSRVVDSLYDRDLNYAGTTRFISPTELQVDLYQDRFVRDHKWSGVSPVRLWVADSDWLHVSEPTEIRIDPSMSFPSDPLAAPRSKIVSVSPFPILIMNPAGPEFLEVTIKGERLKRRQSIVAMIRTDEDEKEVKLKTQYVSSEELRAWLPRSLWSEHRLRYRFVVQTTGGTCSVEAIEADPN